MRGNNPGLDCGFARPSCIDADCPKESRWVTSRIIESWRKGNQGSFQQAELRSN